MSPEHDPLLQAHYLRQCLSHDKRPIGLLLGAGCPMAIRVSRHGSDEPLIPDIAGVTAIAFSEMRKSGGGKAFEVAHSHFASDGAPAPNIEEFLSHLRSLQEAPRKDSVPGLSGKELGEHDEAVG